MYGNEKSETDSYSYKRGLEGENQRIFITLRNLENTVTVEIVTSRL